MKSKKTIMFSIKQQFTKALYPLIMKFIGKSDKNKLFLESKPDSKPQYDFFAQNLLLTNGDELPLQTHKGKKVLVVNVASNCGFTAQYAELEALYQANKNTLLILGVPSNDFKGQEPGTDAQIAQFCQIGYGVTFPILKKQSVLKPNQNTLYQWLSSKSQNGWCEQEPVWNFSKYLVAEDGQLKCFMGPGIAPTSDILLKQL